MIWRFLRGMFRGLVSILSCLKILICLEVVWVDVRGKLCPPWSLVTTNCEEFHEPDSIWRSFANITTVGQIEAIGWGGSEKPLGRESKELDVSDLFFRYTLDAATDFLLGRSVDSLHTPEQEFATAFGEVQRVQNLIARAGYVTSPFSPTFKVTSFLYSPAKMTLVVSTNTSKSPQPPDPT